MESRVVIEQLELFTHSGESIDLKGAFFGLELFEDLFAPTLYGHVALADAFDIIANAPIIGGERVDIKFHLENDDNPENVMFWKAVVHRLSSVVDLSDRQVFSLHLTSPETIINETKKISKYFRGPVQDDVLMLYRDPAYLGTERAVAIESPQTSLQVATPYWSPFKIIDWFAKSCRRAGSNTPDYAYFETLNKGFQFVSLGTIIEESEPVATLYHGNRYRSTFDPKDLEENYSLINDLYIDNVFDIIQRAKSGVVASQLMQANLTTKTININSFSLAEGFEDNPRLNPHSPIPSSLPITKNAHLYTSMVQEFSFNDQRSYQLEKWVLQRNLSLQRLYNVFRVDVVIPGRVDLSVGRVVKMNIQKNQLNLEDSDIFNPYLSGKYLITAVAYSIGADKTMTNNLQCVTDSFSKALP